MAQVAAARAAVLPPMQRGKLDDTTADGQSVVFGTIMLAWAEADERGQIIDRRFCLLLRPVVSC